MLSKRLQTIYDLVKEGDQVADIGADHGQLVIALVRNKIVKRAFACDNKKGPFEHLILAVSQSHLESKIATSLSSGLDELPKFVDTIIIAGMGGELINDILLKNLDKLKNIKTLILAPNTLTNAVRMSISKLGYMIDVEALVFDKHYYEIMRCVKGEKNYDALDYDFGPILRRQKSTLFFEKYQKRLDEIKRLLTLEISDERRRELTEERERIENNDQNTSFN